MGLRDVWRNYKVLIVMGSALGLLHWGWYELNSNPVLRKSRQQSVPEPGIEAYVTTPPAPPAKTK